MNRHPKNNNQVRIIAGKWRGRKLSFADAPGLRPTPDSVRETVFNWLMPYIENSHCLDLFAGTGAMAFEALSRGAASAVCIDNNKINIDYLNNNKKLLNTDNLEITYQNSFDYLKQAQNKCFDIIFIDPPFYQNHISQTIELVANSYIIEKNSLIYLEHEKNIKNLENIIPESWELTRSKAAGKVTFSLYLVK